MNVGFTRHRAVGKKQEEQWARCYHPPSQEAVNRAKEQRRIQSKMYKMVKEFLGTIILVAIGLEVAHFQRDCNSFLLHQGLEETFTQGFEDVSFVVCIDLSTHESMPLKHFEVATCLSKKKKLLQIDLL